MLQHATGAVVAIAQMLLLIGSGFVSFATGDRTSRGWSQRILMSTWFRVWQGRHFQMSATFSNGAIGVDDR